MNHQVTPSETLRNPLQQGRIPSLQLVDNTRVWGSIGEGDADPLPASLGGEGRRRKVGLSEAALRRLTGEYANALLLHEAEGFHRRSFEDCPTIWKKHPTTRKVSEFPDKKRLQWWPVYRPIVNRDVVSMLMGDMRIALQGVRRTSVLILDIDPTKDGVVEPEVIERSKTDSLDEWLAGKKEWMRRKAAAAKVAYAKQHDAMRPAAIEAVRVMAEHGFDAALLTTRKGWHVVVLLRTPMAIPEANAVVRAWAREVEQNVSTAGMILEAFPKLRADGVHGDLCGLPFSEGQRWAKMPKVHVDDDGRANLGEEPEGDRYKSRFTTRAEDVWTFLRRLRRPAPAALLESFPTSGCNVVTGAQGEPSRPGKRVLIGLGEEGVYEKLYGYDYVCWVEDRLGKGLDAGVAWNQIRPVVASFPYAGHTMAEMLRGMEKWLRSGIHRARRCQTEAGIRELLSLCRTEYRYFERGLGNGTYLNGMNAPELRVMLAELAGSRVRKVQKREFGAEPMQEAA